MSNQLKHYGTKGQKWGIRNYQNTDGTYTEEGKRRRRKNQSDEYDTSTAKGYKELKDRLTGLIESKSKYGNNYGINDFDSRDMDTFGNNSERKAEKQIHKEEKRVAKEQKERDENKQKLIDYITSGKKVDLKQINMSVLTADDLKEVNDYLYHKNRYMELDNQRRVNNVKRYTEPAKEIIRTAGEAVNVATDARKLFDPSYKYWQNLKDGEKMQKLKDSVKDLKDSVKENAEPIAEATAKKSYDTQTSKMNFSNPVERANYYKEKALNEGRIKDAQFWSNNLKASKKEMEKEKKEETRKWMKEQDAAREAARAEREKELAETRQRTEARAKMYLKELNPGMFNGVKKKKKKK